MKVIGETSGGLRVVTSGDAARVAAPSDEAAQLAAVLADQAEAAGAIEHLHHELRKRCVHDWVVVGAFDTAAVCRRCGLEVRRKVVDLGTSA